MIPIIVSIALGVGALCGWFFVPWGSNLLLCRSYDRTISWWKESCRAYGDFTCRHPGIVPLPTAAGWEGAVGIWRKEALREAAAGTLTNERLQALVDAGIEIGPSFPACTEEERKKRYEFSPRRAHRVTLAGCGALGAFGAIALTYWTAGLFYGEGSAHPTASIFVSIVMIAALFTCVVALMAATVCDLRARIIPFETCVVVAVAGTAFQAVFKGLPALGAGALFAVVVVAGCSIANRFCRARCPTDAIGRGDIRCMAALSLATGMGAFCGFVVCYTCAALFALAGCLLHRLGLKDGVPMAPFLSVWFVCGVTMGIMGA